MDGSGCGLDSVSDGVGGSALGVGVHVHHSDVPLPQTDGGHASIIRHGCPRMHMDGVRLTAIAGEVI